MSHCAKFALQTHTETSVCTIPLSLACHIVQSLHYTHTETCVCTAQSSHNVATGLTAYTAYTAYTSYFFNTSLAQDGVPAG